MKLNLGVQDIAYTGTTVPQTTAEVAEKLEQRYGVMDVFYRAHHEEIADMVASELADRFMHHRVNRGVVFLPAVQNLFDEYLLHMEHYHLTGIRLQAAQRRGTSFIDTGTYRESFRAWLD